MHSESNDPFKTTVLKPGDVVVKPSYEELPIDDVVEDLGIDTVERFKTYGIKIVYYDDFETGMPIANMEVLKGTPFDTIFEAVEKEELNVEIIDELIEQIESGTFEQNWPNLF